MSANRGSLESLATWTTVVASIVGAVGCSGGAGTTGTAAATGDAGFTNGDASISTLPDGGASDGASTMPSMGGTFETIDTSQYLSASTAADAPLEAVSVTAGADETFTLHDLTGGPLKDGDEIQIATAAGEYLSAANGGGGALSFDVTTPGDDETFIIVRIAAAGPIASGDEVALKTKVTGNYVSAINGGGGEVLANAPWDKAWETYTFGLVGSVASVDGGTTPTGDAGPPVGSTAKQKVLAYLASSSGRTSAIGIEDKDSSNPHADSDTMASEADDGRNPSFWSGDWGFGSAADPSEREDIVQEGEAQWAKGALVQYIYHACPLSWGANEGCEYQGGIDPIDGSNGDLDDTQWADLTTSGGTLNGVWLARLDVLATYFQELKDAGVAPLFRPFHEMNGAWAWWQGRPGPTGSLKLYQLTHDYLVNAKGLDNIVWVWNVQDYTTLAADVGVYNPGASYFDIAALDVYNTGYTSGNYQAMLGAAGDKPIGIAECATLPTPDLLTQQPKWAYVAMWPDYLSQNASDIAALFNDSAVVTLASMPGWN
jgi:mannan endo-1,4-beta-mannosidase